MTLYNECVQNAVAELRAVGIEPKVEVGGKHVSITWQVNGQNRRHASPLTPSDHRSAENTRHQIRRMLRADGFLMPEDDTPLPSPRVFLQNGRVLCSSREIAEHFSKQHKNVLRDIDTILGDVGPEFGGLNFEPSSYVTTQGKEQRSYNLTRDGFTLLVMGFIGPEAMRWKLKYIEAFNSLENQLGNQVPATLALPSEVTARIEHLEGELKALTDLMLEQPTAPAGHIFVAAHFRKIRKDSKRK